MWWCSCARRSRCHRPILTCMHSCRRRWPVRGNWSRRLRNERQLFICGQMTLMTGTTWECSKQGRAGLAKRGRISFGLCNSCPIMRRRAAICSVYRRLEIDLPPTNRPPGMKLNPVGTAELSPGRSPGSGVLHFRDDVPEETRGFRESPP
jgi:hypothetical protein